MSGGDFHVTIKIRNGRIVRRMRELGIETVSELARRVVGKECGQHRTQMVILGQLLAFKRSPISAIDGKGWTDLAMSISAALHCEPEDLWPESIKRLRARAGEIGFYADEPDIRKLTAPDVSPDRLVVGKLLEHLNPRERTVIERHFGLNSDSETLREIAEEDGITPERVRQIELKALQKMRSGDYRAEAAARRHLVIDERKRKRALEKLERERKRRRRA